MSNPKNRSIIIIIYDNDFWDLVLLKYKFKENNINKLLIKIIENKNGIN